MSESLEEAIRIIRLDPENERGIFIFSGYSQEQVEEITEQIRVWITTNDSYCVIGHSNPSASVRFERITKCQT